MRRREKETYNCWYDDGDEPCRLLFECHKRVSDWQRMSE